MTGSWLITIDIHDDSLAPGENRKRIQCTPVSKLLFGAVEEALEESRIGWDDKPGTKEFQITVRPCE
jgi:3-oxoacyl-(acyl-carrier-protein) synthase